MKRLLVLILLYPLYTITLNCAGTIIYSMVHIVYEPCYYNCAQTTVTSQCHASMVAWLEKSCLRSPSLFHRYSTGVSEPLCRVFIPRNTMHPSKESDCLLFSCKISHITAAYICMLLGVAITPVSSVVFQCSIIMILL